MSMPCQRIVPLSLLAVLCLAPMAEAQAPRPVVEESYINVTVSAVQAQDLTKGFNRFMPGVSAGADFPVGPGQWVAVEGSYHWQQYPAEVGMVPRIRRTGVSVAARLGRASGYRPFFQVGAGASSQSLDGIGGSRYTWRYLTGSGQSPETLLWFGPGLGADIRVSERIAVRLLADVMVVPAAQWSAAGRIRVGLVFRLSHRAK
jgi:hypothetical protein